MCKLFLKASVFVLSLVLQNVPLIFISRLCKIKWNPGLVRLGHGYKMSFQFQNISRASWHSWMILSFRTLFSTQFWKIILSTYPNVLKWSNIFINYLFFHLFIFFFHKTSVILKLSPPEFWKSLNKKTIYLICLYY